jgi:hypothetical protein
MNTTELMAKALNNLRPNADWVVRGDTLEWLDTEQTQPTEAEIQAEITRLEADYDAKQYQRDRVYPSIQDQLDMQYWDSVNGTTTWKDAVAKVKLDNPKP